MATNYFVISFSIVLDNMDSYRERRASLLSAIQGHGQTYEDTTSFVMIKTESDIDEVKSSMTYSKFDSSQDSFVIVECLRSTFEKGGKAKPLTFS